MIKLNGNTHILQVVMEGAHSVTAPSFWASWVELNVTTLVTGDSIGGVLNGNTDVAMAAVAARAVYGA